MKKKLGKTNYHAITMTAELSDIFTDRKKGVKHVVNLSSKILGEKNIRQFLKSATIIKPSVVFSVDDSFTTKFMSKGSKVSTMIEF